MIVQAKRSFQKDLRKCPRYIQQMAVEVIETLEASKDFQTANLDITRMVQGKKTNYYRIRVGEWRIGCELIEPAVVLLRIMTRGDIYKAFPPK